MRLCAPVLWRSVLGMLLGLSVSGPVQGAAPAKAKKAAPTAKTSAPDLAQQRKEDREALIAGVKQIAFPGVPGALALYGETAVPVAVATSEQQPAAVIAAARLGKGRVVAFGHYGYFTKEIDKGDTAILMKNAIVWASGKEAADVRVSVHEESDVAQRLKALGLQVAEYRGNRLGGPKQTNVALVNLDKASESELKGLTKFVEEGGGLLTCSAGWIYETYGPRPGESIKLSPATQLFAKAGIVWAKDSVGNPDGGSLLSIKPEVSPYLNAALALNVVESALDKERPKPVEGAKPEDDRIALRSLELASSSCVADDTLFLPRVEAIVTEHSAKIPKLSDSKSIKSADVLPWALVSLQTSYLNELPVDKLRAAPSVENFPGAVSRSAKRVTKSVEIDTTIPNWHSTGLYAAPGDKIEVKVTGKSDAKLAIRIGCHKDKLWGKDKWSRPPEIDRTFSVSSPKLSVGNAYGGLVYVDVKPGKTGGGKVTVEFTNAVPAPYFVLGKTTDREWRESIRNLPGPWAEFQTDTVILSVPSETIRKLDLPTQLMEQWVKIMNGVADLASIPHERKYQERYVADVQISAGYMHSGYPIMTHLDAAPRMVDFGTLSTKGEWGLYHEMGHNHQIGTWTFEGTGEVTCNLFALYLLDTLTPDAAYHGAMKLETQQKNEEKYVAGGRKFEEWKSDPFLALIMYGQLAKGFGWDPYKKVFAEYQTIPDGEKPKTEEQKHDQWMVRFSKAVGKNLGPFFEHWGIPTSQAARDSIKSLPTWMPEKG